MSEYVAGGAVSTEAGLFTTTIEYAAAPAAEALGEIRLNDLRAMAEGAAPGTCWLPGMSLTMEKGTSMGRGWVAVRADELLVLLDLATDSEEPDPDPHAQDTPDPTPSEHENRGERPIP